MPTDYWPDARDLTEEHWGPFVDLIREVRDERKLSNAGLCREVRLILDSHNRVPGREPVTLKRISAPSEFAAEGKNNLSAMQNGTRKYMVGYLAWLCKNDEARARAFYKKAGLEYRPYEDDEDPFAEASDKDQFLVYEVAFLWYGIVPPPAQAHESAMTPEVAKLKQLLHTAIDLEKLSAETARSAGGGYSRIVQREELQRFAEEIGSFPKFLFPDRKPSQGDTSTGIAALDGELEELLRQLPQAVTDWAEIYAQDEWAIYEAAFLWHGFIPPPVALHERVMPDPVRRTKLMLHDAANANTLMPAYDDGFRLRNVMVYGTRHVSRSELRRFATSIEQRPRFLFPEDDEAARAD